MSKTEIIINRKIFINTGIRSIIGIALAPSLSMTQDKTEKQPYKINLIKDFVQAGHNNLDKVKEMLAEFPNLISCRYDWGGGDFEEAIEGAGHVGNKEITNYIIEKGARVNLFTLTMLGKKEIVESMLEEYADLIYARGPHGFTLLHYAKMGGDVSSQLIEYLTSKGLLETKFDL